MNVTLQEKARAVKEAFVRQRGEWAPIYDLLLEEDPAFLDTLMAFQAGVVEANALDTKTRVLLGIAVNLCHHPLLYLVPTSHLRGPLAAGPPPAQPVAPLHGVPPDRLPDFPRTTPEI